MAMVEVTDEDKEAGRAFAAKGAYPDGMFGDPGEAKGFAAGRATMRAERDRYRTGFENSENALDAQIRDDAVVELERNRLREALDSLRRAAATGRPLPWSKRERVDGDPSWTASLGDATLVVHVECEWCFGWSIERPDDYDLAQGSVYIAEGEALGNDAWDYQHVERAQARCEAVARALLATGGTA